MKVLIDTILVLFISWVTCIVVIEKYFTKIKPRPGSPKYNIKHLNRLKKIVEEYYLNKKKDTGLCTILILNFFPIDFTEYITSKYPTETYDLLGRKNPKWGYRFPVATGGTASERFYYYRLKFINNLIEYERNIKK